MSLIRRAFDRPDIEERATSFLSGSGLPTSFSEWLSVASGSVTVEGAGTVGGAMRHPVVYRSVSKVAGIVAGLPWNLYDGTQKLDRPPLLTAPSPGVYRPTAWKRTAATSMLLQGGVYAWADSNRSVTRLDLIDPCSVDWNDRIGWTINSEPVDEWPTGPLWQVPFLTLPGSPKGVNPLEYARRTTFAGLAAQEFGSGFFADGGHPSAILAPEKDPGPDGAAALKAAFVTATSGTTRTPAVLPQSIKYQALQINPDDSQFIELMQFSGAELAGFFGLMPEHVGLPADGGMTYSNRENRQQDLLQDAVMPILAPVEEALSELFRSGRQVRFNVDGVLRPDLAARYASYEVAARIGQMTGQTLLDVNTEMRPLENLKPFDVTSTPDQASARQIAEMIQKIYLGVGVVISADEAREIINREGGGLEGPAPTEVGE